MKPILFAVIWIIVFPACLVGMGTDRKLSVSQLFSDHMVLQQKINVNIWGVAASGEKISVAGSWGKHTTAIADMNGQWKIKLKTPTAGGPYTMAIKTGNSAITIHDVLIGEVWLASGQSNMDIPVKGWPPGDTILNSKQEIAKAIFPKIRFFKVPFNVSVNPLDSVVGKWLAATPETAGDFSATAYFYARKLQQELNVPVGIIQSSIGGTPAEAWTSKLYLEKLDDFKGKIEALTKNQHAIDTWFKKWPVQQVPLTNEQWKTIQFSDLQAANPDFDDSHWTTVTLPGRVDLLPTGEFDGAIWLRRKFNLRDTTTDYTLDVGSVDDMDATYVNGKYVGGLVGGGFAKTARKMVIPKSCLILGVNIIAIRVIDTGGQGLLRGPIALSNMEGKVITLEGNWRSRPVAELLNGKFYTYGLQSPMAERPDLGQLNSNSPTVLFNAMINPLVPFTIKGVIWYQGESNVGRAEQYKRLFPNMIADWRNKWGEDLPFYFVQLAPYHYSAPDQSEQSQKLRNAQRYALKLPKTGMVTTLDIGYLKTAHPPYKQEVGNRLARFALKNEYGQKNVVASGPLFRKATVSGNNLIIEFASIGSGLLSSSRRLDNFELAGNDHVFVKARADIVSGKVVVSSALIPAPRYVRYAWSDTSSATLFNREGIPAATFTSEGP